VTPADGGALARGQVLYERLRATKDDPRTRDAALLVVRLALAWVFLYHGARTLFGGFGGPGIDRTAIFFANVAHLHPATFFAGLSGVIEFFGAIAVGVGVLGRLAGLALIGDMVMAMITVTWANGVSSSLPGGGYELNLALAALAVVVALLGTGRVSLDVALRHLWERRQVPPATPVGDPGLVGDAVS
jgi:putative oxidoreductase